MLHTKKKMTICKMKCKNAKKMNVLMETQVDLQNRLRESDGPLPNLARTCVLMRFWSLLTHKTHTLRPLVTNQQNKTCFPRTNKIKRWKGDLFLDENKLKVWTLEGLKIWRLEDDTNLGVERKKFDLCCVLQHLWIQAKILAPDTIWWGSLFKKLESCWRRGRTWWI